MRSSWLAGAAISLAVLSACNANASPVRHERGAVLMTSRNLFSPTEVAIARGQRITFVSESHYALHILVLGGDASAQAEPGAPSFGGNAGTSVQPEGTWTSPAWSRVGTYHVTCTIHPAMNLAVKVIAPAAP